MLEKIGAFFDARLDIYDEHQLGCIDRAREFYPFTAGLLPDTPGCRILDLGCGTGLELEPFFARNPSARVTGIDLAPGMLARLREKFAAQAPELICASYFEADFGENAFDGAVSVESLHHFTYDEKLPLYRRLHRALKPGAAFILTDYFAGSDGEERHLRQELLRLKQEQGIADGEFYHFDTPLTVAHEIACLREAGFAEVTALQSWGATHCIRAVR